MKVLFLTCWYPTSEHPNFGVFVQEHARAIKLSGVDIQVVHLDIRPGIPLIGREVKEHIDDWGIPVLTIRIMSKLWKGIYIASDILYELLYRNISRRFDLSSFSLIHSNVIFPAGILGHRLAGKLRLPHVITEHWTNLNTFFSRNINSWKGLEAYSYAHRILPVSNCLKQQLHQFVSDHSKVVVVPNVVDGSLFKFRKKEKYSDATKFLMVCSLVREKEVTKCPDLAIRALAEYQRQYAQPVSLEVIGTGDQLPFLRNLASSLGLTVRFAGSKSKAYIATAMQNSDYFVHASEIETFSVVIAEALQTGTPVIASKVGAIPELIHQGNGVLVSNTIDSWVKGIREATLSGYQPHTISRQLGDRFSYRQIGPAIYDAGYDSVARLAPRVYH